MRHAGREVSPVETTVGRVRVSMARYACDGCGTSVRPRGRAMDIEGSMTPTARRMASLAGSSCCYAEADRLLVELAEVNYGAKRIERTTRSVGDDVESRREAALSGALSVVSPGGGGDVPARKPLKKGEILCVALDGTGVPARPSETAGRAGRDGGGGRRTVDGSVPYFAAVESAEDDEEGDSPVARRRLRELAAAGHAPGDVGVCIGDGAEWLRRRFGEWFPDAVAIIDFFHAAEYLWAAAGARYAECGKAADYIEKRRDRMRYDEYLARGLPIGSGRAEAAYKTVVGRCLKCTGMRWSVDGANPVLWVRCARLSGWFDDCWDERLRQAA